METIVFPRYVDLTNPWAKGPELLLAFLLMK